MISLERISFSYPNGIRVLENLDFSLQKGQKIGIRGANGSGKTTLLHIIMGLLKPLEGRVVLFGHPRTREGDFVDARSRMGFVFQDADDQLFCPTVAEDVGFGPRNLGHAAEETLGIVRRTLDMLGIGHLERRVTYQLSAGEKRLVAIATALAMDPEVLILDEPTTGLTEEATENLLSILERVAPTMILVSHDRPFMGRAVGEAWTLREGRLCS